MKDINDNNSMDKRIMEALLKKAMGYDYEEKIIEAKKDGTQGKVKIIKKHMPPDIEAIKAIRRMKMHDNW